MDPITYEALRRNPELLDTLRRQAHRERAQTVHRLIITPIKRLFSSNAARAHLAHPRKVGRAHA